MGEFFENLDKNKLIENVNVDNFYDKNNPFFNMWRNKYIKTELPVYLNNLVEIEFNELFNKVNNGSHNELESILDSLFNGDIFLVKNVFEKKFIEKIKHHCIELEQNSKSTFHKVVNDVPNFRREIDSNNNQHYSIQMSKHSFYFFPWNEDKTNLFNEINKIWRITKKISGYYDNVFENNIPENGVIDRIQIVKYPYDTGQLELHQDPMEYQKFFISGYMSKKGIDFEDGGVYCLDKNKKKNFDIEKFANPGDLSFGLPSIMHGVDKPTEPNISNKDKNSLYLGRWFMGLYSMASDYVVNRYTASPIDSKSK
ncbi:hypothetical protein OAO21_06720 [Alphaproteobacteria bacterium]|nr:hypothetical protein [Alphaproteobacteria bacterium]